MRGRRGETPLTGFKYKAFISYSWADKDWAAWLHRALETYRAPSSLAGKAAPPGTAPARLHPIFKDREEEAAGHSIGASIEAAMLDAEFMIVLCSPRSARSKWVNREVAFFKTRRDPRKILTMIVDGEPGASATPGREAEECFPKTLLFKVTDDLQPTAEAEEPPLAADARDTGDGKRGAKLKLAAAMLGLGLDDLVRRDDRRRAVRRRAAMAASLALAAVLGGLSIFAFSQRDAAVLARNEAVAAKNAAQAAERDAKFQRDDAQGLIEFMLTDFRKELDSLGRLDVLERTAKRLLESYSKQDIGKLDANALGRRARALLLLGEVDNTRGNLDAALARYREASATTEELLKRNPGSAQQIFDHAQSVFWVGYIAWQRGDHAAAKEQFAEYHDLAQQLVAIDPDKDEWRMELEYAYSNNGTLAIDEGEAAEAEQWFRKSLLISLDLLEENPDDVDRVLAAGQSHAWLADSLFRQAQVRAAKEHRSQELSLYRKYDKIFQNNLSIVDATAIALYRLSQAHLALGERNEALEVARAAVAAAQSLLAAEPGNADFLDRAGAAFAALGQSQLHLGDHQGAEQSVKSAHDLSRMLVETDSSVAKWQGHIESSLLRGALMEARGRLADSEAAYRAVIEELGPHVVEAGSDSLKLSRYCSALAGRARVSADGERAWLEIVSLSERASGKLTPEALAVVAEAHMRAGSSEKAKDIASSLYLAGYRHPEFVALLSALPELQPQEFK